MKNIVSKEIIGLVFKSKESGDKVIVCGVVNYALTKDNISHSESSRNWAKEHGENFIVIRYKSIFNNDEDKSSPLEKFFTLYTLDQQRFDSTKWID